MGSDDSGFVLHGGETPGFSSSLAYGPKSRTGIVVLSNETGNDGGLGMHLMRPANPVQTSALKKALTERKEVPLDPAWVEIYAGRYKIRDGPEAGMVITIERRRIEFVLKEEATPPEDLQLHGQSEKTFFTANRDLEVTFQKDGNGKPISLRISFVGTETVARKIAESGLCVCI